MELFGIIHKADFQVVKHIEKYEKKEVISQKRESNLRISAGVYKGDL